MSCIPNSIELIGNKFNYIELLGRFSFMELNHRRNRAFDAMQILLSRAWNEICANSNTNWLCNKGNRNIDSESHSIETNRKLILCFATELEAN